RRCMHRIRPSMRETMNQFNRDAATGTRHGRLAPPPPPPGRPPMRPDAKMPLPPNGVMPLPQNHGAMAETHSRTPQLWKMLEAAMAETNRVVHVPRGKVLYFSYGTNNW